MTNGFLDDLPDLDILRERKRGWRESTSAKSYSPKPSFVDCPAVRQRLVSVLVDDGIRRNWQAGIVKVFRESKNYDQQWANDPNNPFPVEWLENDLPRAIRKRQFDKLSQEDYSLWRRVVKERTDLNVTQGSDRVLKIFDEKQQQYWKGHPCFFLWDPNISKILGDENLLCFILGVYHDLVCDLTVVTDDIRNMDPDTHDWVMYFAGQLTQVKLETLLAYAEAKGLLETVDDDTSIDKIRTDGNRVPWDNKDPNFYENKKAVDEAVKVGHEHDVDELKKLDYDKLGKLLRKPDCTIRYMSVKSPRPRGRVNKRDWRKYLKVQIRQAQKTENAVEQKVLKRMP